MLPGLQVFTTLSADPPGTEPPSSAEATPDRRWYSSRFVRIALWTVLALAVIVIAIGIYAIRDYLQLARVVDAQLARGPYARTINFYAAPEVISTGDQTSPDEVVDSLRRAGASFTRSGDLISIHLPGAPHPDAEIHFAKNVVTSITARDSQGALEQFTLPAPLVSNVSTAGRERRVLIHFTDLPPVLVNAITSAEDKHFFTHGGYDPLRIAKAMYVDAKSGRKEQGASTISMQLARNLYLNPEKRWKRKVTEFLITIHLEHALTKQQIFEYYCNQVYLGGYGTFSINGFGAAAHAYFNKDVKALTLPEAATLAGLIQRPSHFNPLRSPERARDRRNVVLRLMHANRYITDGELEEAVASPLKLAPGESEVSQTQFSMDLANAEFQKLFEGEESSGITDVHTTIDMRLQHAAERAVANGMAEVDRLLAKHRSASGARTKAEAALIALDPHTGAILAVVGGRDYSASQLNRVMAHRPPGSVFKPFVYAAALNSALNGGEHVLTPASTVVDEPTVFSYDGQTYKPSNFKREFHGTVTLRQALAKSMNIAAVKVGEMAGFDSVVALARSAGMNEDIRPTPAVALGAYQVTPLEIARAYTAFANGGQMVQPGAISTIGNPGGEQFFQRTNSTTRVLDPRVNFQMVSMMQDVLKYGTGDGVRARGFTLPAAGKTGTSHDGWFAGFTSQILCIVWVGFDDYTELGIEGAHSALPIWAAFMTDAAHRRPYKDVQAFLQPDGLVQAAIDPSTGLRPTAFCPWNVTEYFLEGTQPKELCLLHQDEAVPVISAQMPETQPLPGTILGTPSAPSVVPK